MLYFNFLIHLYLCRYVPAYNYYPQQVADAKQDTEVKDTTRLINLPGNSSKGE